MLIALIGGTARTGALVLDELLLRGHHLRVLVRADGRVTEGSSVTTVVGDCRDRSTLGVLIEGTDAVVSALGPRGREETLHRDTAHALVASMRTSDVQRFVGISGMAVDVPRDQRSLSNTVAAQMVRLVGGPLARDKRAEYAVFAASDLDWTLARPPRFVDVVEHGWYVRQAPFVATAKR